MGLFGLVGVCVHLYARVNVSSNIINLCFFNSLAAVGICICFAFALWCVYTCKYVCVCVVSMQDLSLRGVMKVMTYPLVIQFLVGIMYCVTVSERRKG